MPTEKAKKTIRLRYLSIFYQLTFIVIGMGILMLVPILLVFPFPEEQANILGFLIPAIGCITIGLLARSRIPYDDSIVLNFREGSVIVIFSWLLSIFIAVIPFLVIEDLNFTLAMFETVSGLTTTGLTVIDVTQTSKMVLFWRSLIQLVGGAGIAIIMISAIIGPQGMGLYAAEGRSQNLLPNIIKSTKLIIRIYLAYAAIGFGLYMIAGMNWFDAINHAFTSISTGGFSTRAGSIGEFNSPSIELISIILMLLGSINFAAQYMLLSGNFREFFNVDEIKFKGILIIIFVPLLIFYGITHHYTSLDESVRVGIFEMISAMTTTGFSITSHANWHGFALFVMIMVMIVGGGYGSTSGGIKLFRAHVLLKSLYWQFEKFFLPKNVIRQYSITRHDGKYFIDQAKLLEIANFVFVYLTFYVLLNFVMLIFDYPLGFTMFEAASVLSGVGLSVGITGPSMPAIILWAQIFGMILGRLEFIVIFVAIYKLSQDSQIYFFETTS